MRFSKAAWLLAFAALSACTAIVSTPDLPVCTENSDCEVANRLFADRTTECLRYRCVNGGCSLALPDLDADGEVSAECGGTDCDDMNAARRMGATEMCDLVDNDCDFVVDEALPSEAPELGTTLASGVGSRTNALTSVPGESLLLVRNLREDEVRIARLSSSMAGYDSFSLRSRRLRVVGESTVESETSGGCVVRESSPIPRVENDELRRGVCGDASDCGEFDAPCVAVRCEDSECVYDVRHSFCDDDDSCNGQELCTPTSASADTNGCVMPADSSCAEDALCDALSDTCLSLVPQACSPVDIAVSAASGAKALATIDTDGCPSGVLRLGPDVGPAEEHVLLQSAYASGFVRGEVDVDAEGCTRDGASSLALAVSSTDPTECGAAQPAALVAYIATPFQEERECDDSGNASQVRVAGAHFVPVLGEPLVVPTDEGAVLVAGETGSSARPVLVALDEPGRFLLMFADAAGGLRLSVLGIEDCAPEPGDIADAVARLTQLHTERMFTGGVTHIALVTLPSPDSPGSPSSGSRFAVAYSVGCGTASRSFLATVEVRGSELEVSTPTDIALDRDASHPTLQVSTGPVLLSGHSAVTEDARALLVAWRDEQLRSEVLGRRFKLDASPIDAVPFVVNAATDDNSIDPAVFVDETGVPFVSYTRPDEPDVVLRPFCGIESR